MFHSNNTVEEPLLATSISWGSVMGGGGACVITMAMHTSHFVYTVPPIPINNPK